MRMLIELDDDVVCEVDRLAGPRERTAFIRRAVDDGRRTEALRASAGALSGAADRGAWGWSVVDPVTRSVQPVTRDEDEQARYLHEVYEQLRGLGITATFPFTFASYSYPTVCDGPDLDVGAYGIVRCFDPPHSPAAFDGVNWQPKAAFHRLSALYGPP